ncbi:MAG TPA: hypothetical protein PKH64_01890 [Petrotogaceae bacterium]|mgnify:FL=1|nr:hypothetical protein [Petrotogaceae bacterium]HOG34290.1 hypothetical protein [Petrotogaceae bacterium]HPX15287.1 hypothetical protein [Petrotogaceae bacterium]HQC40354.1 hypothetical protein [Petrotogaceae bacterium]
MEIKTVREAADELLKKIQQYKELWKKLEDNVSLSDKKMDAITRAEKTALTYFEEAVDKAKDEVQALRSEIEKENSFFFKKNIEMVEVVSNIENRIEEIKKVCDSIKIKEFKDNLSKEVQMLSDEISDRYAEMQISISEAFKASHESKILIQNSTEGLFRSTESFKAETIQVLVNTQEETEKKFNKIEHKLKNYRIVTIALALVNILFSIWLYFKSGL